MRLIWVKVQSYRIIMATIWKQNYKTVICFYWKKSLADFFGLVLNKLVPVLICKKNVILGCVFFTVYVYKRGSGYDEISENPLKSRGYFYLFVIHFSENRKISLLQLVKLVKLVNKQLNGIMN